MSETTYQHHSKQADIPPATQMSQLERRPFPHEVESKPDQTTPISQDNQTPEKVARAKFDPGMISLYPAEPNKDDRKEKPVQKKAESPTDDREDEPKPIQKQADTSTGDREEEQKPLQRKTQEPEPQDETQRNKLVQTKLTVGKPGDRYENEADQVAAKVMTMPDPTRNRIQRQSDSSESDIQTKSLATSITPLVQRQTDDEVQTKAANKQGNSVNAEFENRLASNTGGGGPLPGEVRSFMEPRFGVDLGHVRVHTGADAAHLNKDVRAQAFTYRNHIFYSAGKSPGKDELTAHELTHVIQQVGATQQKHGRNKDNQSSNQKKERKDRDRKRIITQNKVVGPDQAAVSNTLLESRATFHGVRKTIKDVCENRITNKRNAKPASNAGQEAIDSISSKKRIATNEINTLGKERKKGEEVASTPAQMAINKIAGAKKKATGEKNKAAITRRKTSFGLEKTASESRRLGDGKSQFAPPSVKPTFATTQRGIDILQPKEIVGTTKGGLILYCTDRPEQSLALARKGIPIRSIPQGRVALVQRQQRGAVEAAIAQFMKSGSQRVSKITAFGKTVKPRIQKSAGRAKTLIQAATNQNQQAIRGAFARSQTLAQSQARNARGKIQGQYNATVATIRANTAAARQRLQTAYDSKLAEITHLETQIPTRVSDAYNKGSEDFREAGRTVGQEAVDEGQTLADRYARESPPEPSNSVTEFLESFDRETYITNWRNAKIQVAHDIAAQYKESLIADANAKADELVNNQQPVVDGMNELVTTTRSSIETKYTAMNQQLNQAEEQALQTARKTLDSQLQSINQSLGGTLNTLRQMEAAQLRLLNVSSQQQKLAIERQAVQLTATLDQGVSQASRNLQNAFEKFSEQARGKNPPNLQVVKLVIAQANVQLDKMTGTTSKELETSITNAAQGLVQQGQQTVTNLNKIGQSAAPSSTEVTRQLADSLAQSVQGSTQVFTQLRSGHTTGVNAIADGAINEFNLATTNLVQQLDGVIGNVVTELENSVTGPEGLEAGLRGSFDQLRTDINTKAKEEADKVQPAWKQIAKIIVDVVITIAVTVAIAALAASGVGIVAAIGLAALIGAAGAVLKQGANDLIDGKMSSLETYATQAGFGAIGGVLQLVGLRGADKLGGMLTNRAASYAVRTGLESAGDMGADVTGRLAAGEDLSVGLLINSAATSLLGNAGGKALEGGFSRLGSRLGADQVQNPAIRRAGSYAAETTSETVTDVSSQVAIEGEPLSLATIGQSAATSALGTAAGRGAQRAYGDRLSNLGRNNPPSTNPRGQGGRPDINTPSPDLPSVRQPNIAAENTSSTRSTPTINQPLGKSATPIKPADRPAAAPTPATPIKPVETSTPVQGERSTPTRSPDSLTPPTKDSSQLNEITTPRNQAPVKPSDLRPEQNQEGDPIRDEGDRTPVENTTPPRRSDPDPTLVEALPDDLRDQVPVQAGPGLTGNTVRVCYDRDGLGGTTNIRIEVGPDATPRDIELHAQTVRDIQRYSGLAGRARALTVRIQNWFGIHGTPPVGSRAWEGKLEVEKLSRIIDERMDSLASGRLDPEATAHIRTDIDNLQQQLDQHQQDWDEMDTDPGRGFVAAQAQEPSNEASTTVEEPESDSELLGKRKTEKQKLEADLGRLDKTIGELESLEDRRASLPRSSDKDFEAIETVVNDIRRLLNQQQMRDILGQPNANHEWRADDVPGAIQRLKQHRESQKARLRNLDEGVRQLEARIALESNGGLQLNEGIQRDIESGIKEILTDSNRNESKKIDDLKSHIGAQLRRFFFDDKPLQRAIIESASTDKEGDYVKIEVFQEAMRKMEEPIREMLNQNQYLNQQTESGTTYLSEIQKNIDFAWRSTRGDVLENIFYHAQTEIHPGSVEEEVNFQNPLSDTGPGTRVDTIVFEDSGDETSLTFWEVKAGREGKPTDQKLSEGQRDFKTFIEYLAGVINESTDQIDKLGKIRELRGKLGSNNQEKRAQLEGWLDVLAEKIRNGKPVHFHYRVRAEHSGN